MTLSRIGTSIALLLFLAACGPNIPFPNGSNGENGNGEILDPVWPTVADTFAESCAFSGCHGSGSLILELVGDDAHDAIVGVPSEQVPALTLVEAGDPDYSYLFLKVMGMHVEACEDAGIPINQCGTQMPPPPNPQLPQERLQAIRGWIADGAQLEE